MDVLCGRCAAVPAKFFDEHMHGKTLQLKHHANYKALECSAESGCPLCKLFVHALSKALQANDNASLDMEQEVLLELKLYADARVRIGTVEGPFTGCLLPDNFKRTTLESQSGATISGEFAYNVCTIRAWIEHCRKSHESCLEPDTVRRLPARLVNVGTLQDKSLSLFITDASVNGLKYLALSHCWGTNMPASAQTTSQNFEEHRVSLHEGSLPRTYQDFVTIARHLGVQYVWIDSLCILQDDLDDWQTEASRMNEVYSGAYLTIAAAASADGSGGCRMSDGCYRYGPVDVLSQAHPDDHSSPRWYRLWDWRQQQGGDTLEVQPLSKRGWAVQERELSPMIVHYCRSTLYWECREFKASREFPWRNISELIIENRLLDKNDSSFYGPSRIPLPIVPWMRCVIRYTRGHLTRQSDVLPALIGMSKAMASRNHDTYFAGCLWSYFIHSLLWWSVGDEAYPNSRPSSYLAPSWSWASIKGPVTYPVIWPHGYWIMHLKDHLPHLAPKILEICLLAHRDTHGTLDAGFIRVEGMVRSAGVRRRTGATFNNERNIFYADSHEVSSTMNSYVGRIVFDVNDSVSEVVEGVADSVLLLYCMCTTEIRVKTYALVLRQSEPGSAFHRVGLAHALPPAFWDKARSATVVII